MRTSCLLNAKKFVRRGLNIVSAQTVVLLYHRIAALDQDPWSLAVKPEYFAEQLEVLRRIGVISLRDAEPSNVRPFARGCSIAITFDDGYADNFTNALPLLEKFEVPATFFVTTGYVGKSMPFWWDELQAIMLGARFSGKVSVQVGGQRVALASGAGKSPLESLRRIHPLVQQLDAAEQRKALDALRVATRSTSSSSPADFAMTEEQLLKMSASPFAEIGAHTVTHPKLSALSARHQSEEIEHSKAFLKALSGKEITSFSYPYGASLHFTKSTERLVIASGFQRACTTEDAVFRGHHGGFGIPRLTVPNVNGEQFSRWLWSYLN